VCLACEEQEYFFRVWCVGFLARGEMPPGVTVEDLQALGLPSPEEAARLRAQESGKAGEGDRQAARSAPAANAFACDTPDE
jgi:hypothetical protein